MAKTGKLAMHLHFHSPSLHLLRGILKNNGEKKTPILLAVNMARSTSMPVSGTWKPRGSLCICQALVLYTRAQEGFTKRQ